MLFYILVLLTLVFLHFAFIDHLSKAMQGRRLAIIDGIKELRKQDAPEWLISMWEDAVPKIMFERGLLKYIAFHFRKRLARKELAGIMHDVKKLPNSMHEIHKEMDTHAAVLMMSNSPYFSLILILIGLVKQSQLSVKSAVPHQESRAAMATA